MQNKVRAKHGTWLLLGVCVALPGILLAGTPAPAESYLTFDLPDCPYTNVAAINDKGDVAGECEGDFGSYGFVRIVDGTIQTFDVGANNSSGVNGINRRGETVGNYYSDKRGHTSAFLRKPDGHVQIIKIRNTEDVFAAGINDSGEVAGEFRDASDNEHGFFRDSAGNITSFDAPGVNGTFPRAINNGGLITGGYNDASRINHGFIRFPDGSVTTFDPPGSNNTFVEGLNNGGAVTGYFIGNGGGFIRNADGTFTTFFAPEDGYKVVRAAINDKGSVAGEYDDNGFPYHGFLRKPNGSIANIDVPGHVSTYAQAINRGGLVAGSFEDEDGVGHGFIRMP
jgi:hypothetical protein